MATKKDLVEAYSFSRRRLVTAFVSGAPGGREVEPNRPGRTIIGGIALAILLIAGAAVAGVFKSRTPDNWTDPGLISSEDTAAAYVILDAEEGADPVLRPIINITSANLIFGTEVKTTNVPQADIDDKFVGSAIGILEAPTTVPDDSELIQSGWTACTGTDFLGNFYGLQVDVSGQPAVEPTPDVGLVVRSRGKLYLVAEAPTPGASLPRAFVYPLPQRGERIDSMLLALDVVDSDEAVQVPPDWLTLFDEGGALDAGSFDIEGMGEVWSGAGQDGIPTGARIGDYYETPGGMRVITADGPAPFDEFASAVYLNTTFPTERQPRPLTVTADPPGNLEGPPYAEASWPDGLLDPKTSGEHCAQLLPETGEVPVVRLVDPTSGEASAAELEEGQREVSVDTGRGAYVLSGGFDNPTTGEPFLIDDLGSHALVGVEAVPNLGYAGVEEVVVPERWVQLFDEGVALSKDAALRPPTSRDEGERGE